MRMMVKCGNEDCKSEFYVESKDPVWVCQECEREIINRFYPFLTAKLMQAKIDVGSTDWKEIFLELIKTARIEINARGGDREHSDVTENAEKDANTLELTNSQWKEKHDKLIEDARDVILSLEIT